MIETLELQNFKSFRAGEIGFKELTLFAGANASGKSTILQSILLFKQADLSRSFATLHLNGDFVNLGSCAGILYRWAENDDLVINLVATEGVYRVEEAVLSGADDSDSIETEIESSNVDYLQKQIRYLSAWRITPEETYKYSALRVSQRDLGPRGEYTIAFLSANAKEQIAIAGLRHPEEQRFGLDGTLSANVNAWMQDISFGVDIVASRIAGTNLAQLRFGFTGSGAIEGVSSHNVGFGLTYTLPIVTLVLSAQPGDVLIIENPEAHIHPAGQISLGRLLATAANHGVQVIVETHSDHIFNGIRLYIKDFPESHSKVKFYFVDREMVKSGFESKPKEATVSAQGKFTSAPNGFFDAWEKALFELISP